MGASGESSSPRPSSLWRRLLVQEDLNFLLTNRIPRRAATQFMGWFSRIENEELTRASIAVWKRFADDLRLEEAETDRFRSLHDCFTRKLRADARPIDDDRDVVVSPCDGIIGAHGVVEEGQAIQAKGLSYPLAELLGDAELVRRYEGGRFVTIRLQSNMYHRFHAPYDCRVRRVVYFSGDTWNVNPIALARVERLFCKNERAMIDMELADTKAQMTLVPVAAILVAGIKLHCLEDVLDLSYRGPNVHRCDATYAKGAELGYFQAGSTIIAFATPDLDFDESIKLGSRIRMGQPLLRGARGR